mgnify:FL=1|jgi:hypothetical protein
MYIKNELNNSLDKFKKLINNCKIYIDTSSLLNFAFERWLDRYLPVLKQQNNYLIILPKVYDELKLNMQNDDLNLASVTKNVVQRLLDLENKNLIKFEQSDIEKTSASYFNDFFKDKKDQNCLLITNDYDVYKSIDCDIKISRINKSSDMSKFRHDDISKIDPRVLRLNQSAFKAAKAIISSDDAVNKISKIPAVGSTVYDDNGNKISILSEISAGGEGIIYSTNTEYVAKIYKKEHNTQHKFQKLKLMLGTSFDCAGVCYPTSLIYNTNSKSEFVGYLMPKASGEELQKSVFIKPLFERKYKSWNRIDLVELLVNILHKIVYLHSKNIIIGDINPANILFVSPREIYFVDTDSYQVGPFPCPVGTVNFTAPEIQGVHYGDFLRTMEHENFAVATLCFMIMMTGKTPYSHQGGSDPAHNIKKMLFPYRFEGNVTNEVPDGMWKYIWSHLPYKVKEGFYNTFSRDGSCSRPDKRLSSSEWLDIFKYYLKLFRRGNLQEQDSMSIAIWPTRSKKVINKNF